MMGRRKALNGISRRLECLVEKEAVPESGTVLKAEEAMPGACGSAQQEATVLHSSPGASTGAEEVSIKCSLTLIKFSFRKSGEKSYFLQKIAIQ